MSYETKCSCNGNAFFLRIRPFFYKVTYFWACWVVSSGNEQPFLQVGELLEGIQGHLDGLLLQGDVPLSWPLAIVVSLLLTGSKSATICHGHSCKPSVHAAPSHLTVDLKPYFFG
jgi:hypothetical protein